MIDIIKTLFWLCGRWVHELEDTSEGEVAFLFAVIVIISLRVLTILIIGDSTLVFLLIYLSALLSILGLLNWSIYANRIHASYFLFFFPALFGHARSV